MTSRGPLWPILLHSSTCGHNWWLREELLWDRHRSVTTCSKLQGKHHRWTSTCTGLFSTSSMLPHSLCHRDVSVRPVGLALQRKPCDLSHLKLSESTNTNIYKWNEKPTNVITWRFSLCSLSIQGWNSMPRISPQNWILSVFPIKVTTMLHLYSFTCRFYKVVTKFATLAAAHREGVFNQAF